MLLHKRTLNGIIAKHTGQAEEKVAADAERDFWMGAEEAKAYGMIDEVINKELR
jgi:ATP-dependent Clp protease protease subunit